MKYQLHLYRQSGLIHGLSYGKYKIEGKLNDSVIHDSGCTCAGAISNTYYKLLKLNNPSLELTSTDSTINSASSNAGAKLNIDGKVIIPIYDMGNNKVSDVEFYVINNLTSSLYYW